MSRLYSIELVIQYRPHRLSVAKRSLKSVASLRQIVCELDPAIGDDFNIFWRNKHHVNEIPVVSNFQLREAIYQQTKGDSSGLIRFFVRMKKQSIFPLQEHHMLSIVRYWCAWASNQSVSPLYLACELGDLDAVQALLQCKPSHVQNESEEVKRFLSDTVEERINKIEDVEWDRQSPIHIAATNGHTEVVALLLSNRADIEARGEHIGTPLHCAASKCRFQTVALLLHHKAYLEAIDNDQHSPLGVACINGHAELASYLIAQNASIGTINRATYYRHSAIVPILLAQGADIETMDYDLSTPLHYVAFHGCSKTLSLLISQKANICAQNKDKSTPLHRGVHGKMDARTASLLIQNGADVDAKENIDEYVSPSPPYFALNPQTPLLQAARRNNPEVVALLITLQADLEAIGRDGCTPLHNAVVSGHGKIISLLIESRANINALDENLCTPLHRALLTRTATQAATILISNKAEINVQDKDGQTPLHKAVEKGCTEVVALLIHNKANKETRNKKGKTPLDCADARKDTFETLINLFRSTKKRSAHHL